jgi:hypothetical protein
MTTKEIDDLKKIIISTAAYYQRPINEVVLIMMVEDLSDLPFDRIAKEFELWRKSSNPFFPLAGQIREKILPPKESTDSGVSLASIIFSAISKHGWNNLNAAKEMIGPVGWEVVKRFGGWQTICTEVSESNKNIYFAQVRELAALLSRIEFSTLEEKKTIELKASAISLDFLKTIHTEQIEE